MQKDAFLFRVKIVKKILTCIRKITSLITTGDGNIFERYSSRFMS